MVYFDATEQFEKGSKQLMKLIFIQKKVKRLLSMIEKPTGVQDKSLGVPLPIFINKKTKEPLKDKKVIDESLKFTKNKVLTVGLPMTQKFFGHRIIPKTLKN